MKRLCGNFIVGLETMSHVPCPGATLLSTAIKHNLSMISRILISVCIDIISVAEGTKDRQKESNKDSNTTTLRRRPRKKDTGKVGGLMRGHLGRTIRVRVSHERENGKIYAVTTQQIEFIQ